MRGSPVNTHVLNIHPYTFTFYVISMFIKSDGTPVTKPYYAVTVQRSGNGEESQIATNLHNLFEWVRKTYFKPIEGGIM